jgi:hypothetical protein
MRGRHLHIDGHPVDTPEALRAAYRAATDPRIEPRLHALWLLRMTEVVLLVGFVDRAIQKWLAHDRSHGRAGLIAARGRSAG